MPLTKKQKQSIVSDFSEKVEKKKIILFTDYKGLSVGKIKELKKKLKETDSDYKVIKKTLAQIVFKEKGIDYNVLGLDGQLGVVIGYQDEILPAKILSQFSKTNKELKVLGGILGSIGISSQEALALAKIPPKEQLLSQIVYGIKSPVVNFVGVLSGNIRNLVFVLNQIANK